MNLDELMATNRAVIDLWPETGQALGLTRSATYRRAHDGTLPTLRLGRRLVVPVPALRRLLGADPPSDEGSGRGHPEPS